MTYPELERWWEVDLDVLVTTAIAEATGDVHSTVSAALQSDDWIEQWADALYAGAGELASSAERMEYTCDERLKRVKRQAGVVNQRMGQANALLKAQRSAEGWDLFPAHLKDARLSALSILAKHHVGEVKQLRTEEHSRRSLPVSSHLDYPSDVFDAIENAVERGLIEVPVGSAVRALLSMPPQEFTSVVAGDVNLQRERCDELRHPLVLRRWANALEYLRDQHCELAGVPAEFTTTLAKLDMSMMRSMRDEDAWAIINRRRFVRALAPRWRECQMHKRQLGRTVAQRSGVLAEPWREAERAVREELARRHPEQVEALLVGFAPFCEPGTTRIPRGSLTRQARNQLVRELKEALADGRWRRLLDGP
ncbi:hypothetical protein [Streptomyces niveus]|uniref:hypothetical protein n=1 Tax=Streptomyces niveus TaxID=193462 RepID=UPI00343A8121